MFRFGILGAGRIARKFCEAFAFVEDACVCAVASRSLARAQSFADACGIANAYGDYAQMLETERPDAVYIATTPPFHLEQILLCIEHRTPVLCEKAMFVCRADAERAYAAAKQNGVFLMEATWTLFLPNLLQMRRWIEAGRIGTPTLAHCSVGWKEDAPTIPRFDTDLPRGGAMSHMGVYCYELLEFLLGRAGTDLYARARFADDGVTDVAAIVTASFGDCLATMQTTAQCRMDEHLAVYGTAGRIYAPHAHWGNASTLYTYGDPTPEPFTDTQTVNGFEYEIAETIRCVRAGLLESERVPHSLTLHCCDVFDRVSACAPGAR